ncbi:hypothetical protein ACOYW6_02040 [Parablastomonas sp. CN1-191]|uniref:hypothetical protein n=1 Tax=Parablastomonas sp. CN1-191 TaxID=3400908 RepID=UPI003BF7FCB9
MSRAINLSIELPAALAMAEKEGVPLSASEQLPGGGCQVVARTSDGADTLRRKFKGKMIEGKVARYAFARLRGWA